MHSPRKPRISRLALCLFSWYARMYLRRHMHTIRVVAGSAPDSLTGWPVIVCMNHPSWWDPLVALTLARATFSDRNHYAPIDSVSLAKYPFFKQLGFFGIEPGTVAGAQGLLRSGKAILADASNAIWITGQGSFSDARNRPVVFRRGIGHLAHSIRRVALVPLAVEYTFWDERSPEVLVCWGEPIFIASGVKQSAEFWTNSAARGVEEALDRVAELSKRRERQAFKVLLSGSSGVGGIYDIWRGLKARSVGRRFTRQHGSESF